MSGRRSNGDHDVRFWGEAPQRKEPRRDGGDGERRMFDQHLDLKTLKFHICLLHRCQCYVLAVWLPLVAIRLITTVELTGASQVSGQAGGGHNCLKFDPEKLKEKN